MAGVHFQLYDTSGRVLLDLADNVAGGFRIIDTGQSNGSVTIPTTSGEFVEFAYDSLVTVAPAGQPSRNPYISVAGNVVSWMFDVSGASANHSVSILAFTY